MNYTRSINEIIEEIIEVLMQCDGETIQQAANQVLINKVNYIGNEQFEYWFCSDPDTGQFCKQVNEDVFDFKQDDMAPGRVDLTAFTAIQIEECISSYGYTLFTARKGTVNVYEFYKEHAKRIIAECLYESGHAA